MTAMVIVERDPASLGWFKLSDGGWIMPDGRFFQFPPGQPAKIIECRQLHDNEIVRVTHGGLK